jgi:predicted hotdog family 3-hydroxylacyl-ACP dehydratase
MADYIHDIRSLLPQAPPFVMVDELLYSDGSTSRTCFRIRPDNVLLNKGRFTAGGLMENIAQTVAAGAARAAPSGARSPSVGYIVSVKDLQIKAFPETGDELLTEVVLKTRVSDIVVISGTITCKGIIIATGEMKILISV